MLFRNIVLAAALGSIAATVATAEPQQQGGRDRSPAPSSKPVLVMASAETPTDDASEQEATDAQAPPAPAKPRRAARVTTCRCGDGQ